MKADIPLIGLPKVGNSLLSFELMQREAERMLENNKKFYDQFKIMELRKSCGVEPEKATVNVRRPPRYLKGF